MIVLPLELKPLEKEALNFLAASRRGEIYFSSATYQLQFFEGEKEVWVFLQFDRRDQLKDFFCSCEESYQENGCKHVAAAFLTLFDGYGEPLHVRFESSFWNAICRLYFDRYGDDYAILIKKSVESLEVEGRFSLTAKKNSGREFIRKTFFDRHIETEETSIKFSNLSDEEIRLFRQGRPRPDLRYELSYWSDLAKGLFFMALKKEAYKIGFGYSQDNIPERVDIEFRDLLVSFKIDREELAAIVPFLPSVSSPLKVRSFAEDSIEKIFFDSLAGEFVFEKKAGFRKMEGIKIGQFIFVPGDGFYAGERHHLSGKRIGGAGVADLLNRHRELVKSKLVNAAIHNEKRVLRHLVFFDDLWKLHIKVYFFEPGDLDNVLNHLFADWIYVEGKGFYPVDGNLFNCLEKVVEETEVEGFVRENSLFLNSFPGFEIHVGGFETRISYRVTAKGELVLSRKYFLAGRENIKDFGNMFYIKREGFYLKSLGDIDLKFFFDRPIAKDEVSSFIHTHRESLELIPDFFSSRCPVDKVGVDIALEANGDIVIAPRHLLLKDYENKETLFFGDFTFVRGDGFFELPGRKRLSERYSAPIKIEKRDIHFLLAYELEGLKKRALTIDRRLLKPEKLDLVCLSLSRDREGRYISNMEFRSELGGVALAEVKEAIENRQRFLISSAGLLDVDYPRFKWLKKVDRERLDPKANVLRLSAVELLRLNALERFPVLRGGEILRELLSFESVGEPDVSLLKSSLWRYQHKGVQWLWFLYSRGLSGILCDDMGLGKTHQAMGLMAAVIAVEKKRARFVVVCPTSVLHHWLDKLREFMPEVRVLLYHGPNRKISAFAKYNLLLTSYGTLRKDSDKFKKIFFECAIFDEIQAAKNQASRIHASLLAVNARTRLGLTGTPIENRLGELKAIFDIILPSYMPDSAEFKEFFIKPIEKGDDRERRELLARYVAPFLFRRRKEEVLTDLPEKIEEIAHVELSEEQRIMYNELLLKQKRGVIADIRDSKKSISYIHVFALLSSLKQVCDHPACFLKHPEKFREYSSGKWELFVELLQEALAGDRKVVVFSQYLAMLDIIERYLKEERICFSAIRGATVNRGEQVKRFNNDPDCRVFVASLQAAGLGIDLTAGSVVIHYDRWWNRAKEDQATDRVHRIGQYRGVQVFKLVTIDTFEEKIDRMIQRKGRLMEDIVTVDDHRFMKKFDRAELAELFNLVVVNPKKRLKYGRGGI